MAASVTVRTLTNLSKISRSFLSTRPQTRLCTNTSSVKEDKSPKSAPATDEVKDDETGASEVDQKLQAENEKLQADLKSVDDKYKRALAETENVRTRMKKQVEDMKLFGIQGFCKDLLEVADILDQATDSVPKEELASNPHLKLLFEGMTMTNVQLLKVFSKHGLTKVTPEIGGKFDPHFHEALFEVPAAKENEAGTVAILQKSGFKLHSRTLRPALVGVFKANS